MTARLVGPLMVAFMAHMLWPGAATARRDIAAERDPVLRHRSSSNRIARRWRMGCWLTRPTAGGMSTRCLPRRRLPAAFLRTVSSTKSRRCSPLSRWLCAPFAVHINCRLIAEAVLDFLTDVCSQGDMTAGDRACRPFLQAAGTTASAPRIFYNCLAREAGLTVHAIKLPQHTRSTIVDGRSSNGGGEPTSALGRATTIRCTSDQ